MKLFKKLRKGFTLIELVVVIAVIAILTAVSVVSYVAITNKAKQSADEQAVRQMNTILQANSVLDLKSINDVYAAFAENDISAESYKPLFKDRYFFWDSDTNQIVYTDKNYVVIYPESLKGQSKGDHQWYSLTQSLAKVAIKATDTVAVKDKNGNVVPGMENAKVREIIPAATASDPIEYNYAVQTPEQLYTVGQELKDAMLTQTSKGTSNTSGGYKVTNDGNVAYIVGDVTIDLASDLDLMGGALNLCVKGNFTLNGHGHKIRGVVNNRDFVVGKSKTLDGKDQIEKYGTGLLGYISGGDCVIKDVTIENSVFGYSEGKGSAIVGYASNANLEFDNVVMDDCVLEAYEHSVGGFIGDVQGNVQITLKGTNAVKNCTFKLHESGSDVSAASKECYGAGYFIGRQTQSLVGDSVQGTGTFSQSGNSKVFDPAKKCPESKAKYFYWDDAVLANRKNCDK